MDLYSKCSKKYLEIRDKLGKKYLPDFDRFYGEMKGSLKLDSKATEDSSKEFYKDFILERDPEFLDFGTGRVGKDKGPQDRKSQINFYISRNYIQKEIKKNMTRDKEKRQLKADQKFLEKQTSDEYCQKIGNIVQNNPDFAEGINPDELKKICSVTDASEHSSKERGEGQLEAGKEWISQIQSLGELKNDSGKDKETIKDTKKQTLKSENGIEQNEEQSAKSQEGFRKSREEFKKGGFRLSKKKLIFKKDQQKESPKIEEKK